MARRRRDRSGERVEATVKLGFVLLMLVALCIGGMQNFLPAFFGLLTWLAIFLAGAALVGLVAFLLIRHFRKSGATEFMGPPISQPREASSSPRASTDSSRAASPTWTADSVREALAEIDWYQFEKFCAALLQADHFSVARKGGAQPDGGVDLIVEKAGSRALIQCKHWRTWQVQERVVREMLGSMSHFGVRQGAIYTLKGWTQPAAQFAALHDITLVNGDELAQSAMAQLGHSMLDELLRSGVHHCPKCEAIMIERSGAFGKFWGCSRYPACRGKLKHAGAR